ncbi:MAG: DNA polymerase IV [Bacilli bacterium]|nr:DNA polymerase IV [Bacilli bacterium]
MERIFFHIDVNNAFLSWSAVDLLVTGYKIDIRTIDAVIGGDESKRAGIVLAKSQGAKKKGIITGEPLYTARKKCPGVKVYPPKYNLYQKMSNSLFELLSKYTPDIEIFSIDECFIDYGKVKKLYGDELAFAEKLKDKIQTSLGFTVNIGIGNNKLCAKMASDFLKPNMIHTLFDNEIKNKMWPLAIDRLFGVGKKTSAKLKGLGINTIGDLALVDPDKLRPYFKNQTNNLIDIANGIDASSVVIDRGESKGISNSTTLEHDLKTKEEIYKVLHVISENLALALRKQNRYASVVVVILKDCYFKTYSHQQKLKNATNITDEIFEMSKKLLDEMWTFEPIRLVGIRLDNLVTEVNYQMSLFESFDDRIKHNTLDKTIDELKSKYGCDVIQHAYLKKENNND